MTSTTTLQLQPTDTTAAKKSGADKPGPDKPGRRGVTGPLRALLALPAFALAGYLVWLAFTNICYPVRPALGLPGYTRDSWGGPTYAGVWAVHGACGLAMLAVAYFLVRPFVRRRSS